jgi:hypothetical protein
MKKNHCFQKLCQIKLSQPGFFLCPLGKGTTGDCSRLTGVGYPYGFRNCRGVMSTRWVAGLQVGSVACKLAALKIILKIDIIIKIENNMVNVDNIRFPL